MRLLKMGSRQSKAAAPAPITKTRTQSTQASPPPPKAAPSSTAPAAAASTTPAATTHIISPTPRLPPPTTDPMSGYVPTPLTPPPPPVTARRGSNLVVLLDGTSDQFSAKNTNLIKLMSILEGDEQQLTYYSSGIGTLLPEAASMWGKVKQTIAKYTDEALCWNFDDFVCDAYRWLMDYYQDGDRVYIFGFSRGAYTARALAGMIQKVGLLPAGNHNQIKFAYQVYTSPDKVGKQHGLNATPQATFQLYRRIFGISRPVSIHFVGVWDTVSSIGGLSLPRLPFASGVKSVTFFRHALALDERRARFEPEYRTLERDEVPSPIARGLPVADYREVEKQIQTSLDIINTRPNTPEAVEAQRNIDMLLMKHAKQFARTRNSLGQLAYPQKNIECWFAGCHSDIGGGNSLNDEVALSDIAFRWMVREAIQCGLILDPMGVALQTAFTLCPPIASAQAVPPELIRLLEAEINEGVLEHDAAAQAQTLAEQSLSPKQMWEIVHRAAEFDERADIVPPSDPSGLLTGKASDARLKPVNESLTPKWYPLEAIILEERNYAGAEALTGQADDVWEINLGRGRIMLQNQFIHRSVLQRMKYDVATNAKKGDKYAGPAATLPDQWGTKWADLVNYPEAVVWL